MLYTDGNAPECIPKYNHYVTFTLVSGNSSSTNIKMRAQMTASSRRVPAVPREEERRKGEISPLTILPTHHPTDATDTDTPG